MSVFSLLFLVLLSISAPGLVKANSRGYFSPVLLIPCNLNLKRSLVLQFEGSSNRFSDIMTGLVYTAPELENRAIKLQADMLVRLPPCHISTVQAPSCPIIDSYSPPLSQTGLLTRSLLQDQIHISIG